MTWQWRLFYVVAVLLCIIKDVTCSEITYKPSHQKPEHIQSHLRRVPGESDLDDSTTGKLIHEGSLQSNEGPKNVDVPKASLSQKAQRNALDLASCNNKLCYGHDQICTDAGCGLCDLNNGFCNLPAALTNPANNNRFNSVCSNRYCGQNDNVCRNSGCGLCNFNTGLCDGAGVPGNRASSNACAYRSCRFHRQCRASNCGYCDFGTEYCTANVGDIPGNRNQDLANKASCGGTCQSNADCGGQCYWCDYTNTCIIY